MNPSRPSNSFEKLLSLEEAAKKLNVSVDALLKANKHNILKPTITSDGKIGYSEAQISKFLRIRNLTQINNQKIQPGRVDSIETERVGASPIKADASTPKSDNPLINNQKIQPGRVDSIETERVGASPIKADASTPKSDNPLINNQKIQPGRVDSIETERVGASPIKADASTPKSDNTAFKNIVNWVGNGFYLDEFSNNYYQQKPKEKAFNPTFKPNSNAKRGISASLLIFAFLLLGVFTQQNRINYFLEKYQLGSGSQKVTFQQQDSKAVLAAETSKIKLGGSILFALPVTAKKNVTLNQKLEVAGTSLFKQDITAPNVIYSINAGDNILISDLESQIPTISVDFSGVVNTFQGQTGDLNLEEGTDISIDGLTISNTSTLTSVIGRGGCSSCLTDSFVANSLTIDTTGTIAGEAIKSGMIATTVGGTGLNSYLAGDLIYASASDTLDTLGIGGYGEFLTVGVSGLPEWDTIGSFAVANVKENDIILSTAVNTLNFRNYDFNLSESPSGQINIQLSEILNSVLGVVSNFNIGGTNLTFTGAGNIISSGSSSLTLDSGTTGAINLGTGSNNKTINIGTGIGSNTINIATNNTGISNVNIGSPSGTTTINSGTILIPSGNLGIGANPVDLDADNNPFALEVAGTIGPSQDAIYDLGSPTLQYRNLYLSGQTTSGGNITISNPNPSISFNDTDAGQDGFLIEVDTSQFTIQNSTSGAVALFVDSNGDVSLAGGSSSTGCTVSDATGNLVCTGNITSASSSGTVGFFTRNNSTSTVSTATAGDSITTSGDIFTSGAGTITSAGLLTALNGASVSAGLNNNLGGITNTGDVSDVGTISFSGAGTDITTVSNEDLTLAPDGTGEIILSNLTQVTNLSATVGTTVVCRNASNQLSVCSSNALNVTLQEAYNAGNTITTTDGRDIAFTLYDESSDAGGSTSFTLTNAGTANAFVLNDTNTAVNNSLVIQSGGINKFIIDENGNATSSGNFASEQITANSLLTANNGFTLTAGALNLTATSGSISATGLSGLTFDTGGNNILFTSANFNTTATGINGTAIGATTPSTGAFTTLTTTSDASVSGNLTLAGAPRSIQTTENNTLTIGGDTTGNVIIDSNTSLISLLDNTSITGTLDTTGNITTAGDLAVNGGDITTNQTTANLFNTTATTLNIGGAATALSLGNSTGTTTVNNAQFNIPNALTSIGSNTSLSALYVTRPLSLSATGKSLVILDQIENQDIFTASYSGISRFTIANNGLTTIGTDAPAGSGNTIGQIRLISAGDNAYSTLFQTGTQTQDITYTLPTNDGGNNYVLSTDGAGVLQWQSVSGVGAGTITAVGNVLSGSAFTGSDSTSDKGNTLIFEGSTTVDDANDITLTAVNPVASITYTLPDLGTDGTFAFLEGAQTFTGTKTFNNTTVVNGLLGVGNVAPVSQLDISRPLALGATGKSLVILDQIENQDIFTASKSGVTQFTIASNGDLTTLGGASVAGNITFSTFNTNGGILYTDGAGAVNQLASQGNLNDCLLSQGAGAVPVFGSCSLAIEGLIYWDQQNGAVFTKNDTVDFLLGSNATDSAKFAVIGINNPRGQQTASVSGNLVLDAQGSLQTTNNQLLTIGGGTTGEITLLPGNGTSALNVNTSNLNTDQATFNLLDTTATTLNIGGAATTISLGAGSGTTTVNNDLAVSGTLTSTGLITADGGATISSGQDLTLASYTTNGTLLYTNGSGVVSQISAQGNANDCLLSNGAGNAPAFGSCSLAIEGLIYWDQQNGAVFTKNDTVDFLLGSNATDSAKFAVIGINNPRGQQTASVSGNLVLDAQGSLQTTNNQLLTIGGGTTGEITLLPGNGTSALNVNTSNLNTDQATFNLLDTTATTLNIGGAATTISLGAGSGTTTVNNDLAVSGTLTSTGLITADGGATISSGQDLTLASYTTNGTLLYTNGSGVVSQISAQGNANDCLLSNGAGNAPAFGSCSLAIEGLIYWDQQNGAVFTKNDTVDFLLGSNATDSAKFAVIGINNPRGQQTASVSGNLVLDAQGSLQTTNNQTLTIGGDTTGNVIIDSNTSLISLLDNTSITGTLDTTGNITTAGDLAVNGGDITTTSTTANLFNTTATTLNIGGAATTLSLGNSSGTTTVNNNLAVSGTLTSTGLITADGGLTVSPSQNFIASGSSLFSPDVTNDVTFITDADSTIVISGLQTTSGTALCLDGSDNLVYCTGAPFGLQAAYNTGNTITTTDGRDIAFTLYDESSDAGGSTSFTLTNAGTANAFVLNDTNTAVNNSLVIQSGGINKFIIDENGNATSSGNFASEQITANSLLTANNGFTLTAGALNLTATSGSISATGLSGLTFDTGGNNILFTSANFNTTATGINGTAIGATTPSTGAFTTLTTTSDASVSGNLTLAGAPRSIQTTENNTLTIGGDTTGNVIIDSNTSLISLLDNTSITGTLDTTGNITTAGDLAVNGGDITTTSTTANLFNTTATTLNIGGAATTLSLGNSSGTTTVNNNLAVSGTLTSTGLITADGGLTVSPSQNFIASGSSLFSPDVTNDVTFITDADSTIVISGLQTTSGTALCLDGSDNLVYCTGAPFGLQAAYNTGNTITTTDGRDIAFTLYDESSDAGGSTSFTLTNAGTANAFVLNDTNTAVNNSLVIQSGGINKFIIDENGNATSSGTLALETLNNQLVFGSINTTTINSVAPTTPRVATIPALSANDTFVFEAQNQTLTNKTIGSTGLTFSGAGTDITTVSNEDLTLAPDGTGEIILSNLTQVTNLSATVGTTVVCRNASNQLSVCSSNALNVTLQEAYNAGNTITTTDGRDIAFTLYDESSDAGGSTSFTLTNAGTANAFVLNDTNTAVNNSLVIQSGGINKFIIDENGNATSSGNFASEQITANSLLTANNGFTLTAGALNLTATSGSISATGLSGLTFDTGGNNILFTSANFNTTATGINGTAIGATTPSTGAFTTLTTTSDASVSGNLTLAGAPRSIQTTENNTLTIGGDTTGNVIIDSNTSLISLLDNTSITGTLDTTGNITTAGDLAVNGGDITTTSTTANLFNTTATTLNIGGAATTLSLGNSSGTTTVNNNLAVSGTLTSTGLITADGGLTVSPSQNFIASGSSLFSPDVTNDVTFITDADSTIVISGLQTTSGTALCLDGSDNLVYCTGAPFGLQAAYNTGNTITTTDGRDIAFTLYDESSDAGGSTSFTLTNAGTANAFVLNDTNTAVNNSLVIQSGGINKFIIDENGNATSSGNFALNGGSLTTSQTTFNLLDTTATTLNIGGAATALSLGNSTGTTTINSTTLSLPNATAINANNALLTIDSLQAGGGYGSTGVSISNTGNIQANGTLTIDGASVFGGTINANSGTIDTNQTTANLFNTTATTLNIGGAATTLSLGNSSGTTTVNNNLAVSGTLTSTGLITANGGLTVSPSQNFIASGSSLFSPDVTNDVTFITDADSTIVISGLQTTSGTVLCLDGSDNLVNCDNNTISLQGAYNAGNTITTTNARDIAFTLYDESSDAGGSTSFTLTNAGTANAFVLNDTNTAVNNSLVIQSGGINKFIIDENGNATSSGNFALNGGSLTTSQTTFNLLDTTATTLNIGGASTTISLGSNTGTTTVNNALAVTDTVTITPTSASGLRLQPYGVSPGNTSNLQFYELSANGSEYTGFKAPDSLDATVVYTLPTEAAPASDYVLTYQAGNTLSWKDASSIGGDITAVGNVSSGPAFTGTDIGNVLYFQGSTVDTNTIALTGEDPLQNETIYLPAISGTVALVQPNAVQPASGTEPLIYINENGASSPNLLQLQTGGTDSFIVDNGGNVAVNGGSVDTAATTANLFNTTATTLNIGGAATTISLGNSTGTTTVNNGLTITGDTNANSTLTVSGTLTANGIATIGDAGDAISLNGTTISLTANGAGNDITANLVDNNTDALDIQQGTNNYININTTDGSENISFGNTSTNPTFSFLGSGNTTFGGNIAVNGGSITTSATTANLFNTTATTINLGSAATAVSIGAGTGTTTINNNGAITADLAVNGGDITTDDTTFNLINTTATTLNIGGAATTISLGNSSGTTTVNNGLTVTGNIIGNANLTVNGQTASHQVVQMILRL